MAVRNEAVCAVNGDYYGIGSVGVVIRNGVIYRDKPDGDVLVLYRDGTMRIFASARFDGTQAMADGAWQAWCFGPALLGDHGEALTKFNSNISRANPRTAIGYYEPGHYCFITVDGRQPGYSDGITFTGLSKVFADLGCKLAYNMDGGQTAVMTFLDQVTNQPYGGGRRTSDMIFIRDQ
jgi:exopolysaccharide biosynthesis protein